MFCVMAAIIARREPRTAIAVLSFFGVCTLFFGYTIARKIRRQRFKATIVEAPGGVRLRGSNSRILMLAALIAVPCAGILFLDDVPLLVQICAWVMFGAIVLLIVAVLTGRVARRFIRFDPQGLTLGGTKLEYQISWDDIADIVEFEMHDNPVVGFDVIRLEAIKVTPESARARVYKALGSNKGWMNRHVVIFPFHFATNAESLCAALKNYSTNREARAGLVKRPALPNGV
jgi:hypothetical protein